MAKRILSGLLSTVCACILMGGSAQATPLFQAGEYPASVTGSAAGLHVFASGTGAYWKCVLKSPMVDTLSAASSTITLAPTYTDCTILENSMTVNTNGCSYRLHAVKAVEGVEDTFTGTFDIVCPEGKSIEFMWAGLCTWKFGSQQGLSRFDATVKTGAEPKDVLLAIKATELTYTEKGPGSLFSVCPNNGTFKNGSFQTEVTLRADGAGGKLIPFWIS